MAEGEGFSYAIAGFFIGMFMFYSGIKAFRKKRLIENIPTSKIRSLAMGLVEIFGSVEPQLVNGTMKSPMTGKPCVYYRYTVEELRSSGKSSRWVTIQKDEKGVPFYVRDDTGKVLVDPAGAKVDIPSDFGFTTGWRKKEPQTLLDFIKTSGIVYNPGSLLKRKLRFSEHFLAPMDKCYVMGEAADNPYVEDATAVRNVDDIMIRKPSDGTEYYVNDSGEKDVLRKLRIVAMGAIFGPLVSAGCLLVIFLYMRIRIF